MAANSSPQTDPEREAVHIERWQLLHHISRLLDRPITVLAFVWLGLLIMDLTVGLSPLLRFLSYAIWVIFGIDFVIEFIIAPNKTRYLRRNWLTGVSLLMPALGTLRIFRALRALRLARSIRSVSLLRLLTTFNRSMRATRKALGRRGVGYVALLTVLLIFGGAAGMLQFESPAALRDSGVEVVDPEMGLATYSEAVWWTAMIITTVGSEYWPQTAEGRLLAWLLSVYALAVFGYLAGTIASFFVDVDRQEREAEIAGAAALQRELAALRREVGALRQDLADSDTRKTEAK